MTMKRREVIDAMTKAAGVLAADEDRMRRLGVFIDMWPEIEAYTPPAGVVDDVHQIVLAFHALATAVQAEGEPK